jgi:hypothetical protein
MNVFYGMQLIVKTTSVVISKVIQSSLIDVIICGVAEQKRCLVTPFCSPYSEFRPMFVI